MIRFLLKGVLRDRHRSLLPVIVVIAGVAITIFMYCWINGIFNDIYDLTAKFQTGHIKVMTRAYSENSDQSPNDLALVNISDLISSLKDEYPDIEWVPRIQFGGLLDVPDEKGETRSQGPVLAICVDLLSANTNEISRLRINEVLAQGRLPEKQGEVLISDEFAKKLNVEPGQVVTVMGSTMFGSMSFYNVIVTGTVRFGAAMLDRSAMIMDLSDAQVALDMNDACGEILGYFGIGRYDDTLAVNVSKAFNSKYSDPNDEFSPIMLTLKEQFVMGEFLDYADSFKSILIFAFIVVMSIVLWNAGLIGGLRRYGEIGVRLAIGENKGQIYRSMIFESILIGIAGSIIGTIIGLGFSYLLQEKGLNLGNIMKNATMMIPSTIRAQITPDAYWLGIIPGLFSTVLGTMLSGIGIYKRQTATLFKELET
jgi:putative ABC transport system permease protein